MRVPWRALTAFVAAGLVAATAPRVPAASTADGPDPSEATAIEACRLLRSEPEVSAHFPRAVELCTPSNRAQPTCEKRPVATCASDALCRVHTTFTCTRSPCPPGGDATMSYCVARPLAHLATSIVAYLPCVRSGGTWEPYPGASRHEPWRGTCSCMGRSAAAVAFTRHGYPDDALPTPLRYFIRGRGCVAEDALCREYHGRWVVKVPGAPFERPRCEIDAQAVVWRHRLHVGLGD